MIYGYMRVSTEDQTHELQEQALTEYGCDEIIADKISGTATKRPGLDNLLSRLQRGDRVVVWRLDRLGRSLSHLITLVDQFAEDGVDFVSVTESLDTASPMGKCMFHVCGAFAQMEREIIGERTKAGLKAAKAKGKTLGKPRTVSEGKEQEIIALRGDKLSLGEIARRMDMPKSTIQTILKRNESCQ